MKIPYRQAIGAILAMNSEYRFSSMELTLLMRFIGLLGDDEIDLDETNSTERPDWKELLRCTNDPYISRLFTSLVEKGVMTVERKYENNGYRAHRALHPAFREAIRTHA